MALPALLVVITVALLTVVALGLTAYYLLRHLKQLTGTLSEMKDSLEPTLSQLAEDSEVTRNEIERVSRAAEELGRRGA